MDRKLSNEQINLEIERAKIEALNRTKMMGLIKVNEKDDKKERLALLKEKLQLARPLLELKKPTPTLKANQRARQSKLFKQVFNENIHKKPQLPPNATFIDPRLKNKPAIRKKRTFIFHTPGTFVKQGNKLRAEERLRSLKESLAITTHQTGIATAVKLASIQPKRLMDESQVPDIEWWDSYLMKDKTTTYKDLLHRDGSVRKSAASRVDMKWISDLIEHPIKIKPPFDSVTEIPLLLTKKEQKKLRRQNRAELQKEEQEKIRLGLAKPPLPKVRLSNIMRVLGTEAVQEPTKIEAYVRSQMEQRKRTHEIANASRKLTTEEKRAKKLRKLQDPTDKVDVSVYKIKDLSHPSHRFKIEKNADQLAMTGIVALHPACNVIVVEGGQKKQKKFKRLMLHRIDWNQDNRRAQTSEGEDTSAKVNKCELIWEGSVKTNAFSKLEFKSCPTELYAREQFRKCDVEQYWDLAYSKEILQAAGELAM